MIVEPQLCRVTSRDCPHDLGDCDSCGHSYVFHRTGTGNGVPLGQEFCDDRHAPPCNCVGFVRKALFPEVPTAPRINFLYEGPFDWEWNVRWQYMWYRVAQQYQVDNL